MTRFSLSSLLSLCLLVAPSVLAENQYTSQLPKCLQPCFTSVIQSLCGSPHDWKCACNITDLGGAMSAAQASTQCLKAAQKCDMSVVARVPNELQDICNQVAPSASGGHNGTHTHAHGHGHSNSTGDASGNHDAHGHGNGGGGSGGDNGQGHGHGHGQEGSHGCTCPPIPTPAYPLFSPPSYSSVAPPAYSPPSYSSVAPPAYSPPSYSSVAPPSYSSVAPPAYPPASTPVAPSSSTRAPLPTANPPPAYTPPKFTPPVPAYTGAAVAFGSSHGASTGLLALFIAMLV